MEEFRRIALSLVGVVAEPESSDEEAFDSEDGSASESAQTFQGRASPSAERGSVSGDEQQGSQAPTALPEAPAEMASLDTSVHAPRVDGGGSWGRKRL